MNDGQLDALRSKSDKGRGPDGGREEEGETDNSGGIWQRATSSSAGM